MHFPEAERIAIYAYVDALSILAAALQSPTKSLMQAWEDGSLVEGAQSLASYLDISEDHRARISREIDSCRAEPSSIHDIRVDFTNLLAHPKRPRVIRYESWFYANSKGQDMPLLAVNSTARALDETYKRAGFQHAPGSTVASDRIDRELSFLAHLLERDDKDTAQTFFDEHLSLWGPSFFFGISKFAKTPEYRLIGTLGEALFPPM